MIQAEASFTGLYKPQSKLLRGCYIGDYIGEYCRAC